MHHRVDVRAARIHGEMQTDLAEHLAGAGDDLASVIDFEQIAVVDEALAGRGRCGDEDGAVACGDVAVVIGDPAACVQVLRGGTHFAAQGTTTALRAHEAPPEVSIDTSSTIPTMAERIGV